MHAQVLEGGGRNVLVGWEKQIMSPGPDEKFREGNIKNCWVIWASRRFLEYSFGMRPVISVNQRSRKERNEMRRNTRFNLWTHINNKSSATNYVVWESDSERDMRPRQRERGEHVERNSEFMTLVLHTICSQVGGCSENSKSSACFRVRSAAASSWNGWCFLSCRCRALLLLRLWASYDQSFVTLFQIWAHSNIPSQFFFPFGGLACTSRLGGWGE
jgi:hypothetical protein